MNTVKKAFQSTSQAKDVNLSDEEYEDESSEESGSDRYRYFTSF